MKCDLLTLLYTSYNNSYENLVLHAGNNITLHTFTYSCWQCNQHREDDPPLNEIQRHLINNDNIYKVNHLPKPKTKSMVTRKGLGSLRAPLLYLMSHSQS